MLNRKVTRGVRPANAAGYVPPASTAPGQTPPLPQAPLLPRRRLLPRRPVRPLLGQGGAPRAVPPPAPPPTMPMPPRRPLV